MPPDSAMVAEESFSGRASGHDDGPSLLSHSRVCRPGRERSNGGQHRSYVAVDSSQVGVNVNGPMYGWCRSQRAPDALCIFRVQGRN